jgi:hypothetical protein
MDSSIKNLTITGAAAFSSEGTATKPRRPGSRRKRGLKEEQVPDSEFDLDEPSATVATGATVAAGAATAVPTVPTVGRQAHIESKQLMISNRPEITPRPSNHLRLQKSADFLNTPATAPKVAEVKAKPIQEVHLLPKPKEISSVILKPPATSRVKLQPKPASTNTPTVITNKTRKARRINLNTATLSNRITRAKKVKEHSNTISSADIRDYLIKKGVIQAKSKAPDTMLRSMYSDFNMLKDNHAL